MTLQCWNENCYRVSGARYLTTPCAAVLAQVRHLASIVAVLVLAAREAGEETLAGAANALLESMQDWLVRMNDV